MTIEWILISIAIGVIATLLASAVIWIFRRQLKEAISSLDMSTGAVFAWVFVFILTGVMVIFPLIDVEIPSTIPIILAMIVMPLTFTTVWRRR